MKIKSAKGKDIRWVQARDNEYITRVDNGETFHIRKDNLTGWWKLYWQFPTEEHGWVQERISHGDFREMVDLADQIIGYSK